MTINTAAGTVNPSGCWVRDYYVIYCRGVTPGNVFFRFLLCLHKLQREQWKWLEGGLRNSEDGGAVYLKPSGVARPCLLQRSSLLLPPFRLQTPVSCLNSSSISFIVIYLRPHTLQNSNHLLAKTHTYKQWWKEKRCCAGGEWGGGSECRRPNRPTDRCCKKTETPHL